MALLWLGVLGSVLVPRGWASADEPARGATSAEVTPPGEGVVLWYFGRDRCPHCARAEEWLQELEQAHPQLVVERADIGEDPATRERFVRMMRARDERPSAVPAFILDDQVWVGFSAPLAEAMEQAIDARLGASTPTPAPTSRVIDLGPLGVVDVGPQPLLAATLIIAFVDGFNPCSLWVLTVLLAMILGSGSRARIAAVGLTFLVVTAAIYGAFIAGLFAALAVTDHVGWIQGVVAVLALGFGLVNVKDYFAYKKGLSFTIPDRFKPRIYRGGRAVRKERPLPATLAVTVAMAAGVALVELPCTAGFPMVWTSLVTQAAVGGAAFAGLLAAYLAVYLAVEIAIVVAAVTTLRASRMQETHGRVLKLVGGMVMIALAIVLLVDPTLMERLVASVAVVASALVASALVLLVDRRWRPQKRGKGSSKKHAERQSERNHTP
jgi:cytochrome c biogenesis protein CcdA/glutaredoxin